VSKTFQICLMKLVNVIRRRFHMPPAKICAKPVFCIQKLVRPKRKNYIFFIDIPKGDSHVHYTEKWTLHLDYKCAFFAMKPMCAVLCAGAILCTLVDQSRRTFGASWCFFLKYFPKTPLGNGYVGGDTIALSESGFKVGKNSLPAQSDASKISWKEKITFFDMIILDF
jgi:hypothetical protein